MQPEMALNMPLTFHAELVSASPLPYVSTSWWRRITLNYIVLLCIKKTQNHRDHGDHRGKEASS